MNLLKNRKSNLKTILRITDDNGRLYSRLSKKKDTRASFIQNTLEYEFFFVKFILIIDS